MQRLENRPINTDRILTTPKLVWEDLASIPTLEAAVLKIALVYDFSCHPYLVWMQAASTSREEFRYTQLPFRFAVESFSQALAAVLARIPVLEARLPLFENIAEEHGGGDRLRSHKSTFHQYLLALSASAVELETPCTTPVLAFNQSILNYCLTQLPEAGAAMLGIIEHLYVGISAAIAHTVHVRGWTAPGSQYHYATHEKLDTEHATDLLRLASLGWNEPRSRKGVAQGLVLGAHYFWSLYHDLLPSF